MDGWIDRVEGGIDGQTDGYGGRQMDTKTVKHASRKGGRQTN